MKKFLIAAMIFSEMTSVAAQELPPEVDEGISRVKQKTFDFSIETRFFAPNLNAQLKSADFHWSGGRVDLRDDLNFTRGETPEILLRYKNFSLDWIHLHGAGKSSGGAMNFGGQNLSGKLDSRSDIHFVKLKLDREIISLMGSGLEWNIALNAVGWHGFARGENSSATKNYFAVVPSVGLKLYMRIRPRLDIYAQFSGLPFGRHGHFADFESGIKYFPRKNFSIGVGWRRIDFKLRRGGDMGKFVLNGPFIGLRYDF